MTSLFSVLKSKNVRYVGTPHRIDSTEKLHYNVSINLQRSALLSSLVEDRTHLRLNHEFGRIEAWPKTYEDLHDVHLSVLVSQFFFILFVLWFRQGTR